MAIRVSDSEFVAYVTRDGDRWDGIAFQHYGDATAYEPIVRANPQVPIRPVLEGGLTLRIPVRLDATSLEDPGLPPWKRRR
jgi:phage tail protein X